ncbi:MAG: geranylgeranylglycerol-phosphate geranylgeranyltransferase [Candidatus Aenigmarchaeota archaeon]|nr:geranylgeranylglycerol-phosphate geranylgeranyltransferase [Candidatus Aenigmarchaeota archaeon]
MPGLFSMIRLNTITLAGIAVLVGWLLAGIFNPVLLVMGIISALLIAGAGNIINDYFDVETDKINRPKRAIPSGHVRRNLALKFYLALTIMGWVISYFVSFGFFLIASVNIVISFLYSWKLKPVALVGNAAVSYLSASSFLAGSLIALTFTEAVKTPILILAIIGFLGTMAREIMKDVEDVKGDKKSGARTFPIIFSEIKAKILSYMFLAAGILILALNISSITYLVGTIIAGAVSLYAICLYNNPGKSQRIMKVVMYIIIITFLLTIIL